MWSKKFIQLFICIAYLTSNLYLQSLEICFVTVLDSFIFVIKTHALLDKSSNSITTSITSI